MPDSNVYFLIHTRVYYIDLCMVKIVIHNYLNETKICGRAGHKKFTNSIFISRSQKINYIKTTTFRIHTSIIICIFMNE